MSLALGHSEEDSAGRDDDGRALRRKRNHDAAVDAILDLLSEGETRPTAQQVAERSGLSIRSIFRLFDDVEALHAAAISRQVARVLPLLEGAPVEGSLRDRVSALLDSRARFYEAVAPVRRFAVRLASTSPAIAEGLRAASELFRTQLVAAFEPEAPSAELLEALDAATSWEMWDRLRSGQELSATAAKSVVRRLVGGALCSGDACAVDAPEQERRAGKPCG